MFRYHLVQDLEKLSLTTKKKQTCIVKKYKDMSTDMTIDFTITDDPYLSWIGKFDCAKYKRLFVVFDSHVKSIWGEKSHFSLTLCGKGCILP